MRQRNVDIRAVAVVEGHGHVIARSKDVKHRDEGAFVEPHVSFPSADSFGQRSKPVKRDGMPGQSSSNDLSTGRMAMPTVSISAILHAA